MTPVVQLNSISGLQLSLHPLGARVTSFIIPLDTGPQQIVEHYPNMDKYKNDRTYSGATIAPFANRLKNAQFDIEGIRYSIKPNEGNNSLHSGELGLHLINWDIVKQTDNEVIFECRMNHLQDGFPGNRIFRCTYTLEEDDLVINFYAETDAPTIVNMTNHTYFNLDTYKHLNDHFFMIDAKGALELDEEGIPTGSMLPPIGKFNLSVFQRLEDRVFDHNFVLGNNLTMDLAGAAYCPTTDLTLEVYTDQPGLQFYTGNKRYFAFETQHFPDSPNHPSFPSCLISPGKPYDHNCIYRVVY